MQSCSFSGFVEEVLMMTFLVLVFWRTWNVLKRIEWLQSRLSFTFQRKHVCSYVPASPHSIIPPEDELQHQLRKFVNKSPCPEEAFENLILHKQISMPSNKVECTVWKLCGYCAELPLLSSTNLLFAAIFFSKKWIFGHIGAKLTFS